MKKYKEEYFVLKEKLKNIKLRIEIMNSKYSDWYWESKIMKVIQDLYAKRKEYAKEYYLDWWDEDILNNYDDECWIEVEEISSMIELFIERKKAKRRLSTIKWIILRNFLYYQK